MSDTRTRRSGAEMSDRFKVNGLDGHVQFINTGSAIYLEMLGQTQGGQRRLVHIELTVEDAREVSSAAHTFMHELGAQVDTEGPADPIRAGWPR